MIRKNVALLSFGLLIAMMAVLAAASNTIGARTPAFGWPSSAPSSAHPFESLEPGESIVITLNLPDGAAPLELVLLPSGQFHMGSPEDEPGRYDNESPQHPVTISQPFFMGRFEITQAQYEAVMGGNPSQHYGVGPNYPVYSVTWFDAARFCNRLSQLMGRQPVYDELTWMANRNASGFRLPTEAEWEYASRAGTQTRFYWGDDLDYSQVDENAWYVQNSGSQTHEVGQKQPNAWGLYDMSGNVWEWCQDWLGRYPDEHRIDPLGPDMGSTRMMRGGSWGNLAADLRSALRSRSAPAIAMNNTGFRIVLPYTDSEEPPLPTPTPQPPHDPPLVEKADLNRDGYIDAQDLSLFIHAWNEAARTSAAPARGDFNRDGAIDARDLFLFMGVWQRPAIELMEPGETITIAVELPEGAVSLDMVSVPAGEFSMGSPEGEPGRRDNESPQHRVTISRPYYIGKYQITQAHYEAVMGFNPSHTHGVGPNRSVYFVSWYDAVLFCNRLSQRTGRQPVYNEETWAANLNANGFRLPTEAEWEYACRAGTVTPFYWGDGIIGDYAWFIENSNFQPQEVGMKRPNAIGLHDMSGNVWEWCHDWMAPYPEDARVDPAGPSSGQSRVFRGGSWGSSPAFLRSAVRSGFSPENSGNDLGFRIVLPQPPE